MTATVTKSGRKPPANRGSRKGVPNKVTAEIKSMIVGALEAAGGQDYLLERALDPKTQTAFMALVGKALPLQVAGDANNPLTVVIRKLTDGR